MAAALSLKSLYALHVKSFLSLKPQVKIKNLRAKTKNSKGRKIFF
jgi:hypothetical protein